MENHLINGNNSLSDKQYKYKAFAQKIMTIYKKVNKLFTQFFLLKLIKLQATLK